ncbi:MAG: heparan-alpha-glucosaminide N-acetyltransferase domain-containing protein, partial [Thermodesulfobacteriota bacterium]
MPAQPRLAGTPAACAEGVAAARVAAIDLLRGLAIALMALDHVRDYFSAARFDPTDLAQTTPGLFLVRWITHPCAPVFVLLAGAAAWLRGTRIGRAALARFLAARGAWLIVLEVTVVCVAWTFDVRFRSGIILQVIWALAASMIVLAGLVLLPRWAIAAFAVVTIAGHHLLDGLHVATPGLARELLEVL